MTSTSIRRSARGEARWLAAAVVASLAFLAVLHVGHGQAADESGRATATCPGGRKQPGSAKPEEAVDAIYKRPRVPWELLDFSDEDGILPRRAIKSVSLTQYGPAFVSSNQKPLWQIDSSDPLILRRTGDGFGASFRLVSSDWAPEYRVMCDFPKWGALHVTATDGEFVVYIYEYAFALDTRRDPRSHFRSWPLSRVVDELYVRKTGRHLKQEMLNDLSGESALRSQERHYAKERKLLQKIADLTAVLEKDRTAGHLYLDRARAYSQLGLREAAIADFTRVIELSPDDMMAWYDRGGEYAIRHDFPRAIADYTKAIQLNPKFLPAYEFRSQAYAEMGDEAKAEADSKTCDKLSDELDKAIDNFTCAIERSPRDAMAWYRLGHARFLRGFDEEAAAGLTKAIQLNPKLAEAYYWRSFAHGFQEYEKAEADMKAFRELKP
jgi:tetratricopeptide (TPR) repeat protein